MEHTLSPADKVQHAVDCSTIMSPLLLASASDWHHSFRLGIFLSLPMFSASNLSPFPTEPALPVLTFEDREAMSALYVIMCENQCHEAGCLSAKYSALHLCYLQCYTNNLGTL